MSKKKLLKAILAQLEQINAKTIDTRPKIEPPKNGMFAALLRADSFIKTPEAEKEEEV